MANTKKEKKVAYLADGTPIAFAHPVDYRSAINAGMSAYPPGTKPPKQKRELVGESVMGVEPLSSAIVESEKPVELEVARQKDRINKIHRK